VIEKSNKKIYQLHSSGGGGGGAYRQPASSHQNAVYWMKISNTFFEGERRS
jgi:hypothetical protein